MMTDLEADLEALAAGLLESTVSVRSARGAGSGSGVVWSVDGTIVTNAHVARSTVLEIEFADGRRLRGKVERRDEERDLASVRVAAGDLQAASYRDPNTLRVGEFVAAFGHPLGVRNVLSTGIVHAPYRGGGAHYRGGDRFVQADVTLEPGNSGGALADVEGRVVGINSMVAGGLALAVPADDVRRFLGDAVPAAKLGVRVARADLGNGRTGLAGLGYGRTGLVVLEVEPGSPAECSGLIPGDVLLSADPARIAAARSLEVLRGGVPLTLTIVRASEAVAAAA